MEDDLDMRFKKNILSIIFAGVFSILMLLGFIHIMYLGYGAFEEDGFQWRESV
jgi:Fe2+ transport system protein B